MKELVCLRSRLALLESQIDMLLAERAHLDKMLVKCGFLEGIPTLMKTVEEVLDSGELDGLDGGNFKASSDM